jgi:hypothetical protein
MFFFIFVAAISLEEKEPFCFLLSSKLVHSRSSEIDSYVSSTPSLESAGIRSKLQEDTFESCLQDSRLDYYSEDLVFKSFSKYSSFISIPLSKYKTKQDVQVSPSFIKRRPELQKQAMMKPRSFKDL